MTEFHSPSANYFSVGGTLSPDEACYIERAADRELLEGIIAGELCYVLATRQIGKSSLMARSAQRLRYDGFKVAVVDLSAYGTEGSEERWYYDLSRTIVRQIGGDIDVKTWWKQEENESPPNRLVSLLRDRVLASTESRLVIFLDEIDTTIGLPFSDGFFAAIQHCYNARATDDVFSRLTFVLIGVASPTDLVSANETPFHVGKRLELSDFTLEEALPLARAFGPDMARNEHVLRRIMYWTAGHPLLTQMLCQQVLENGLHEDSDRDVDSVVEAVLQPKQVWTQPNLAFVRNRLLLADHCKRQMLLLYRQVCQKRKVADDPSSPVISALKLSGLLVVDADGTLQIRNRIYQRVFTEEWARQETPWWRP